MHKTINKHLMILRHLFSSYIQKRNHHICIVGSGPSAFYVAQYLLKHHNALCVDMLEKLPTPFGLVRYGVAPDHPEVKNVINTFTQVAKNPRFNYYGNINVGRDIRLHELRQCYDAILLAHGASVDKKMGIDGENLPGVISAKDLVAWYNGYPDLNFAVPDFDCETVAIVGIGNVAIDVARILLSPIKRLQATDIPEPVISHLATSRVRNVILIGRRGPLQSAFSLKEFRELTQLPASKLGSVNKLPIHFSPPGVFDETIAMGPDRVQLLAGLSRPRRRLTEFLLSVNERSALVSEFPQSDRLRCEFRYLRSPIRVVPRFPSTPHGHLSNVKGLELRVTKLDGHPSEDQRSVPAEGIPTEQLECGLVVRSIGYRGVRIDPDLPFDETRGVIACCDRLGRVAGNGSACGGGGGGGGGGLLYASGWAKRGAVGVIVDTATDARLTAEAMLQDLVTSKNSLAVMGFERVQKVLQEKGLSRM